MGKTIWTRIGAILAALGVIPVTIGTISQQTNHAINMPNWLYIVCIFGMVVGPVIGLSGSSGNISADQIKQVVEAHVANLQQGGPTVEEANQETKKG